MVAKKSKRKKKEKEADDCIVAWTIDDVARFLRMPPKSVYLLAQRGEIPCAKFGRHWRFCREIVEEWFRGKMRGQAGVATRARRKE
jgi:excisionase family DNA binding protein